MLTQKLKVGGQGLGQTRHQPQLTLGPGPQGVMGVRSAVHGGVGQSSHGRKIRLLTPNSMPPTNDKHAKRTAVWVWPYMGFMDPDMDPWTRIWTHGPAIFFLLTLVIIAHHYGLASSLRVSCLINVAPCLVMAALCMRYQTRTADPPPSTHHAHHWLTLRLCEYCVCTVCACSGTSGSWPSRMGKGLARRSCRSPGLPQLCARRASSSSTPAPATLCTRTHGRLWRTRTRRTANADTQAAGGRQAGARILVGPGEGGQGLAWPGPWGHV